MPVDVHRIYLGNIKGPPGDSVNVATSDKVGIVKPDNETITVAEDGTITVIGGVGSHGSGPMNFEVRSDGHLYIVYDDGMGEPQIRINDQGHLVWSYENDE